jgi:D-tyrosyl-tRNA(Tyr) deacylase
MRAVIQRVSNAQVQVGDKVVARIGHGLLVYVGVAVGDQQRDAKRLAEKIAELRIFEDENGKLNISARDAGGGVLAVPNFTVLADARKGRRPAFVNAARGEEAEKLFETFVEGLRGSGCDVASGVFGATMAIQSTADGPVNIILDVPS